MKRRFLVQGDDWKTPQSRSDERMHDERGRSLEIAYLATNGVAAFYRPSGVPSDFLLGIDRRQGGKLLPFLNLLVPRNAEQEFQSLVGNQNRLDIPIGFEVRLLLDHSAGKGFLSIRDPQRLETYAHADWGYYEVEDMIDDQMILGRSVRKNRFDVTVDESVEGHVDVYHGENVGLQIAEFEVFYETYFPPVKWLGQEITDLQLDDASLSTTPWNEHAAIRRDIAGPGL